MGLKNSNLIDEINNFDAFTDIVFNPKKSINTQARSVAIAKTLYNRNQFSDIRMNEFQAFFNNSQNEKESQLSLLF